jgi:hypothetical protein
VRDSSGPDVQPLLLRSYRPSSRIEIYLGARPLLALTVPYPLFVHLQIILANYLRARKALWPFEGDYLIVVGDYECTHGCKEEAIIPANIRRGRRLTFAESRLAIGTVDCNPKASASVSCCIHAFLWRDARLPL